MFLRATTREIQFCFDKQDILNRIHPFNAQCTTRCHGPPAHNARALRPVVRFFFSHAHFLLLLLFCDVNMQRSSEFYPFFIESENGFQEQQPGKKSIIMEGFCFARQCCLVLYYTSAKLRMLKVITFQCGTLDL